MAHVTGDRVKDTSTTTGTGNITVSGSAPTGFRTLSAVATANNDTLFLAIVGGSEWEVCLATRVSANEYARTTILASSNSGSAVNFSAGTKDVFITLPASKIADNTAYASTWDGDTATAPSKNAVYDVVSRLFQEAFISGNWYWLYPGFAKVTTGSANANRLHLFPRYFPDPVTIDELGMDVVTGSGGTNTRLGIYAHNESTFRPTGTPLVETGDLSSAATAVVTADVTDTTVQGWVWFAALTPSGPTYRSISQNENVILGFGGSPTASVASGASGGLHVSHTSGTSLPDLTSASFNFSDWRAPVPIFKVA